MPPLLSLCFGVPGLFGAGGQSAGGLSIDICAEIKAAERENKLIERKETEIMKQQPVFPMMSEKSPVRGSVREGDSRSLPLPAHFFSSAPLLSCPVPPAFIFHPE